MSCTCPSYATVLKNRLTVSRGCLSARTSQSFSTSQCGCCLAVPVPSCLSTLWKGMYCSGSLRGRLTPLRYTSSGGFVKNLRSWGEIRDPFEESLISCSRTLATELLKNASLGLTFNLHFPNCEILWHFVASCETSNFVFILKGQPANSAFCEQHFNGICCMELLRKLLSLKPTI